MALVIEIINGKYTVNGKELIELNQIESKFLDDFFREKKAKESQILNR